ncbi:hypothetical protein WR25_14718 isoform B [Diploscapter pachys]|uniref:Membrane-bound transcription factor site-2 protease n=1 Tax=Diploscapter pachys TaxID=2018661 RepID=A0A2A2J982_9BILA|nr:hypothetical protein WR25_14718 isoform B [Diploscapter pachys]
MRTRSRGYAENEEEVPACGENGDRVEQRPEKAREETETETRKEPATENEAEETLLQIEPRMMGMEVDGETEIRPVIDTQKVHSLAQQTEPKLSVDADVCNALIDYLDEFVGEVIDKLVLLYEMRGKKKLETSDLEIVLGMAHKIQYLPRPEHFRNDYAPPAKMRRTTSKRMFLYFGSMFSTAVCYFLIGWSCIFLIDYILRLKRCLPYLQFVNKYALEVSPFQIRFYTHRYTDTSIVKSPQDGRVAEGPSNRAHAVHPQSSFHRVIATLWFSTGAAVSIICLFGITIYLTQMLLADISMLAAMRPKVAPFRVAPPFGVDAAIPVPAHQQPPVDAPENGSLKKLLNKPAAIEAEREKKQEHQLPNGPGPPEYDVLDEGAKEGGLVPIIPGWNLPWSHMPIFMVILCFAAIIHELGHSWAATSNGVQVNGFGFFFIAVYPGAFTEIDSLTLKKIAPFKRLMVYGAGIWHNLVMAGLAYLLFMATPSILSPLFLTGHGLTVKSVDARSGLHGPAGLSPGHIVDAIDECRVREMADWRECVRQLETQRNGRCIRKSRLDATRTEQTSMSIDELHCCDGFSNITQAHMCFESKEMMKVPQMATKAPSLNRLLNIGDDKEKRAKRQAPIKEQNATDNLNKARNFCLFLKIYPFFFL